MEQLFVLFLCITQHVATDPCDTAVALNNLQKRQPGYPMDATPLCDYSIKTGWYSVGSYTIPTTPPGLASCGTLYPYWTRDDPPTTQNDVATITVCKVGFADACTKSHKIRVKKCNPHLVFELAPTSSCNSAYCFESTSICILDKVTDVSVSFHSVEWRTDASKPPVVQHDPDFNLICNFSPLNMPNVLYKITWYINSTEIPMQQVVSADTRENATLSAKDMLRYNIKKLNVFIHCTVGAVTQNTDTPCALAESPLFFAGIKILSSLPITMKRGGSAIIQLQPTVPFVSEILVIGNIVVSELPVALDVRVGDTKCQSQTTVNGHSCSETIKGYTYQNRIQYQTPANWNGVVNYTIVNQNTAAFSIAHSVTLQLTTSSGHGTVGQMFGALSFPDLPIQVVEDVHSWKGKHCFANTDPHMKTFDNIEYECQLDGKFVLYRNRDSNQEVYLPSGTTVQISIREWPSGTGTMQLDVTIWPSAADEGKTSGLCGILDNTINNDFTRRNGQKDPIVKYPDGFSNSWLVEPIEDIFDKDISEYGFLVSMRTTNRLLCECDPAAKQTFCTYTPGRTCHYKRGEELPCFVFGENNFDKRRKRDVSELNIKQQSRHAHKINRRQTVFPVSWEDAERICDDAFMESSMYLICLQSVPNFSNTSLENCILDIMMTGDDNITRIHIEAALEQCTNFIVLNTTLQEEEPEITYQLTHLCPGNCSGNGYCNDGNCTCTSGFAGSDCSFDTTGPPTITGTSYNICDKNKQDCDALYFYGGYFLENMGAMCYIRKSEINLDGSVESSDMYTINLQEQTLFMGSCELRNSSGGYWITDFTINITVDGEHFTDEYNVTVYNSLCQQHHTDSGNVYFTLKSGYCFIEETSSCIAEGESNEPDYCQICNTSANSFNWTYNAACINQASNSSQNATSIASSFTTTVSTTTVSTTTSPDTITESTTTPSTLITSSTALSTTVATSKTILTKPSTTTSTTQQPTTSTATLSPTSTTSTSTIPSTTSTTLTSTTSTTPSTTATTKPSSTSTTSASATSTSPSTTSTTTASTTPSTTSTATPSTTSTTTPTVSPSTTSTTSASPTPSTTSIATPPTTSTTILSTTSTATPSTTSIESRSATSTVKTPLISSTVSHSTNTLAPTASTSSTETTTSTEKTSTETTPSITTTPSIPAKPPSTIASTLVLSTHSSAIITSPSDTTSTASWTTLTGTIPPITSKLTLSSTTSATRTASTTLPRASSTTPLTTKQQTIIIASSAVVAIIAIVIVVFIIKKYCIKKTNTAGPELYEGNIQYLDTPDGAKKSSLFINFDSSIDGGTKCTLPSRPPSATSYHSTSIQKLPSTTDLKGIYNDGFKDRSQLFRASPGNMS
ncbi:von Willebrand factor D and EGF domain-containing protein-like isoform X2 [Ostrea edulis]|uniref:von Willebrand factor D and EGF domain-containing protein-like isoform X2 n=1 Tax=Ostrea edulis TaxID=37623 RepID=UPI0024AECA01|nr:von Willebrand factor D and EGF domain-containing protein-like isoform X2 [Ostrea edulis]